MRALILAGGFGTRLRPITNSVPKSLIPIGNRPFLEHQIRLLAAHGVKEATLLTGYLPDDFAFFVDDARALGVSVDVATEREPLGTAGAVRAQLERIAGTTIVLNGDVLTDLDLTALVAFHRARAALVTIALASVQDAGAYGLVPLAPDGRIEAFIEKPGPEIAPHGGLINAGTYVLEPRALQPVPSGAMWSFETQLFPALLAAGEPLYGFASDAYWLDIGTPERYLQAHADILSGRAAFVVTGELIAEDMRFQHGMVAGPSLVSDPVLVGPGAVVGPLSCLGREVLIGARARVERSVLHADVRVGVGAIVRDSILGRGVRVPVGAEVVGEVRA